MATLKEYLEKMALRVGSRGAMPGTLWIDYSNVTNFVAPSDGWACAHGTATQAGDYVSLTNPGFSSTVAAPFTGHVPRIFVPCKKGDTVRFSTGSTTKVLFGFLKSVGGGLNP